MINAMLAMFNGWEIVLILLLALILFGAKKLPELARGLGQGIREFKRSTREVTDELESAVDFDSPPPPPKKVASQKHEQTSAPQSSHEAASESPFPEPSQEAEHSSSKSQH